MEHESDDNNNCNWCFWYSNRGINKGTGGLRNNWTSGDHPKYCINEIGQNTEKSPGDLRRLVITQMSVKTQQNSKCRLCGDRDETINHIIRKCSKLAQKGYKARHDCVGKMIHREMYKKFKFDDANEWYMNNPPPILENDTHKLQLDFDIHTDRLISARRPDLMIINNNNKKKKTCKIVDFAGPANHRIKLKECKKEISTSTSQENWENYGTWRWQLYQSWLVLLAR